MDHCGICQQEIPHDLQLLITRDRPTSARRRAEDKIEARFRLLLCRSCWSMIEEEHSASGKHFSGLIRRLK